MTKIGHKDLHILDFTYLQRNSPLKCPGLIGKKITRNPGISKFIYTISLKMPGLLGRSLGVMRAPQAGCSKHLSVCCMKRI